jgi:copper chaperone CopZ
MQTYKIEDMTCGHCVRVVEKTIHDIDPLATVRIDLPTKKVEIDTNADPKSISASLTEAGYAPTPLAA